ncbi:hypothetical protein [Salinicoccus sp. HZC-1]|uniref:hypothetical protein n=1 Tax=Salinicoccus sp. HZC-1 TaxID=3385497 RepID=UPI00398B4701
MRTFLAFKFDKDISSDEITESINRVKHHYYETVKVNFDVEVSEYRYKNIGAVIFDSKSNPLRWDSVVNDNGKALVSYAPPPNWKKFSDSGDVSKAPKELLNKLVDNKELISEFTTPTSICLIDSEKETLDIMSDPFGFARLYEYRGENGWFWSNRSGALPILAGEEAKLDKNSWEFFCGAGWFVDTTSPLENVVRVEPGIRVNVSSDYDSPRQLINNGSFEKMVAPRPYKRFNAKQIAQDMLENFASFSELWSLPLVVDLSGGKDSRVCAAAVIASGAENVQFNTIGTLEQEAETAALLLEKVNLSHKHNITNPGKIKRSGKSKRTPITERAKTMLHYTDGDLSPVSVRSNLNPDTYFADINRIWVQGAMGEIGKATFYGSESLYKRLLSKGENAPYERLTQAFSVLDGIKPEIADTRDKFIFNVINKGKTKGLSSLYLLDYFYLVERARRWLPQSVDVSRYSAFYSKEFLEQSFNMSYEEKINLDVIKGVIGELLPEWKDVPFYKRKLSDKDERTEKGLRLWQTSDKEYIEKILRNPEKWNDMFDEQTVLAIWNNAIEGDFHPNIEGLFDRLIIRACFEDHLDRLNEHLTVEENLEALKSVFNPLIEQNVDCETRLIVFDYNEKKIFINSIIPLGDEYIVDDESTLHSNMKYKYQKKENGKWIDVTGYSSI